MANQYTGSNPGLDPEVNLNVEDGRDNKAVQTALKLLSTNYTLKNEQDSKNELIQEMFEKGFEVKSPVGPKKIASKKLYQAMWRTAGRMKPLDFSIHGTGRPEVMEKITTMGVSTVMDRGGYAASLRDKNGAFFKLLMYGDGFIQIGSNPEKDTNSPLKYRSVSNSNVYVDAYATMMRSPTGSGEVNKCCVIFSYPWAEAVQLFPELKKKGGAGEIPRSLYSEKELERQYEQEHELETKTEIAYFYDINNKNYTVFAGTSCTVLEEYNGDEYPFTKGGEPYIPISQFICMPSAKGFYNHGIGSMLYDLALVSQRLMNMEVGHIEDNVYPVTLMNVPQGEASKFFNKLQLAHEMRAAGKKGYVAMEYDPNNPNASQANAQSLLTQNLYNEWQAIYDILDREIKRMGIFLDEAERGANVTATQVLAEEESANGFVKQIMEYNASETKHLVEVTLDCIKKFVGKKDKTALNLTTKIDLGEGDMIRPDGVTLGMVKDEISKHNYFVKVNARTGAIPSNIVQQAQISKTLQFTRPGTPAHAKLTYQLAQLNDRDVTMEEFNPPAPEMPQGAPGAAPEEGGVTGTDRAKINVRQPQSEPAL
jgi:hypothetical protein